MMDVDMNAGGKLQQLSVFSQMCHAAPFALCLVRRDGTIAWHNATLGRKLNVPEIAMTDAGGPALTLHDIVAGEDEEWRKRHEQLFAQWFRWPRPLTLQAREGREFLAWGWNEDGTKRLAHRCVVSVFPIYVRQHDTMFAVAAQDEKKELLACAQIVFVDDFAQLTEALEKTG